MTPLVDLFDFPAGSHIALVGSGGKTTLMLGLAKQYASHAPVAIGTTTKILPPPPQSVDYYYLDRPLPSGQLRNGVYLLGIKQPDQPKISSLRNPEIRYILSRFGYSIFECDGSRQLPLKGWEVYEPVIPATTTCTVGLLPVTALGMAASPETVHRFALFQKMTGCREGEAVLPAHLAKVISSPDGLFRNAVGRRILFLGQCDTLAEAEQARAIVAELPESFAKTLAMVVAGSGKTMQGTVLEQT